MNEEKNINIEEIMQQIRQEILLKQATLDKDGSPLINLAGKRLNPEFYEHLYYAALTHDEIGVKLYVTKVNVPIIGPIIEKIRTKIHELVIYYVNQIAEQQLTFNRHILQAVNAMAQSLETETAQSDHEANPS
ncbi:MAG: hypothetical protein H6662_04145 [Ardenticatenaceae bacterium]|nr:hypothetical protein [Anaerolineales bacterium]MCB8920755.1 hypothetical protein [Ardenticatenaceae bacterium]MCB8989714.1 hypothetical protein [Ardenticatenaceae bacterium]MCB9002827.1 hypothetical protein [Ardenticatenaceae bacterium]